MIFEIPDLEVLRDILAREWSGYYVAIPHSSNQHLFILWIPVTRDVVLSQEPEDTGHYLFTPSCPCDYVTILSANTPANLTIIYEAGIEDARKYLELNDREIELAKQVKTIPGKFSEIFIKQKTKLADYYDSMSRKTHEKVKTISR